MLKLKPLGNNVLIRPKKTDEKVNGFYMGANKDPMLVGEVLGVGSAVEDSLQVGMTVTYAPYSGKDFNDMLIISEHDIMAIIEETEEKL